MFVLMWSRCIAVWSARHRCHAPLLYQSLSVANSGLLPHSLHQQAPCTGQFAANIAKGPRVLVINLICTVETSAHILPGRYAQAARTSESVCCREDDVGKGCGC